jgi:orotidine-5'-phosphate decarboxylase
MTKTGSQIIVALDFSDVESVRQLVDRLDPRRCRLKVGKELFTHAGPDVVRMLVDAGFDVFLDLKFHDIPNTVAKACRAAAELGVWMVNVHALGGTKMMQAARQAVDDFDTPPLLIGVTVLTSMNQDDIQEVGLSGSAEDNVLHLAGLVQHAGLDGVVCSPREVVPLRARCGKDFALVTPGIRPAGSAVGDQSRIMTPGEAIRAGASYLVIGRPVTQADDPLSVLLTIEQEIADISSST